MYCLFNVATLKNKLTFFRQRFFFWSYACITYLVKYEFCLFHLLQCEIMFLHHLSCVICLARPLIITIYYFNSKREIIKFIMRVRGYFRL